ncbi:unnamed protein product [Linum trigynum]|uniref:Uncharacterized protein n=1 Tax=Linum trigynum TaxID=586398 RepID=A0AAV2CW47_9ROSI
MIHITPPTELEQPRLEVQAMNTVRNEAMVAPPLTLFCTSSSYDMGEWIIRDGACGTPHELRSSHSTNHMIIKHQHPFLHFNITCIL